jgi:SEC-C motif-containing protein
VRTDRTADSCPCGSGTTFAGCCQPLLDGVPALTPQALMRSRYTAFATGRTDHVWRTWHPRTRPAEVADDPYATWTGLQVLATSDGGAGDDTGTVEFVATWSDKAGVHRMHEVSRFERRAGRWLYLDGEVEGA